MWPYFVKRRGLIYVRIHFLTTIKIATKIMVQYLKIYCSNHFYLHCNFNNHYSRLSNSNKRGNYNNVDRLSAAPVWGAYKVSDILILCYNLFRNTLKYFLSFIFKQHSFMKLTTEHRQLQIVSLQTWFDVQLDQSCSS